MKINSVALGALVAASVSAAAVPNDSSSAAKCKPVGPLKQIRATYDDLKFSDDNIPVGTYKDLKYSNFYVDQYDGFIEPSSGTQYAMAFDSTSKPTFAVAKKGDTFNLKSFTFACIAGYPQSECKVRVRGEKADGVTWSANVITYPALDNTKPFVFVKYEFDPLYWSNLAKVEFEYAKLANGRDAGLGIDDLEYVKKSCE